MLRRQNEAVSSVFLGRSITDQDWKLITVPFLGVSIQVPLMSFDEAASAYEKIEGGVFLPEIKTNTLEMIDKRLTKLKMDECGLLVEKLKDALSGRISDTERLHFYEVRKIMRGDWAPREAELAARALNTYAQERDRYEFPILICDASASICISPRRSAPAARFSIPAISRFSVSLLVPSSTSL